MSLISHRTLGFRIHSFFLPITGSIHYLSHRMGQFILVLPHSEEVMFLVVLVRLLVSLSAGKVLYGLYDLDPGSGYDPYPELKIMCLKPNNF